MLLTRPRPGARPDGTTGLAPRSPAAVAVGAVGVGAVLAYVLTALARIGYPYELQYFEGSTVEVSARVTEGLPLYAAPTTGFTPWPYPPLYFWVTGELARVTGLSLPTLRAVSFVASLAALALVVLVVRHVSGSLAAGLGAAGLFAGTYWVSAAWFDAARVDSLLLALVLGAAYAALRARTWRGGLLVGALFLLAFLTKQNALAVAAPVLAWLLWRRRSAGVAASALLAGGAVGSVLLGDALTGGWYSPYVVGQLLGQGADLQWLAAFWVVDVALPFAVVLLGALLLWVHRGRPWPRRPGEDTQLVLAACLGLALAALAGRLHDGGYVNVAIPVHAATAVLLGLGIAAVLRTRRALVGLGAAALVALQVVVMTRWHTGLVPTAADRAAGDALVAQLSRLPGPVLVLSHPYYARLAGAPPHASLIAVDDLLATRPGPARDALAAQLPWSLDGVDAVVLDSPEHAALFGGRLERDFTLVTTDLVPGDVFLPPTDVATKPALLYVRKESQP